ncbi:DUF4094 domain-containing protein [Aegicerativicinus sediminis]
MRIKFIFCLVGLLFINNLWAQTEDKSLLDKNSAFVALLVSYSNTKKENNKNLLENVISSDVSNFSIKSAGGYFLQKHFAVGLGLDYSSENEDSENVNTFGPNTFLDRSLKSFAITPFVRYYIPVGANNRFFLFTQTGLEFGFGNGDEISTTGEDVTTADIKNRNYGIAFTPGVILIVQKGFAFEVNVGVLGFQHSKETVTPSDEEETVITRTNFNLDIDLLSLNLGISYYF